MSVSTIRQAEKSGNVATNAFNKLGRGFLWTGTVIGRLSTFAVAAVPGAAFATELANAFSRGIKGYDVAPSYINSLHTAVDPMLHGSALTQQVGLGAQACLASAEIANTVGGLGGNVAGVIASHTGEQETGVDVVGRVVAHSLVACVAGYGAVRILEIPVPRPPSARA